MAHLQLNPTDVSKWLEFINYDILEMSTLTTAYYERRISIFERAIHYNPQNFRLKLELVKFKADSAEIIGIPLTTIETDFLSLIFFKESHKKPEKQLANQFESWFEFLNFLIKNNSALLSFRKIKKFYQKCFSFFLNNAELVKGEFLYNNILHLLDTYCKFLKEAGFIEKAVSIYQALIDFNFCECENKSSQYANVDFKSKIVLFELYWDIGLPKFGEKFSNGWINCLEGRDALLEKLDLEPSVYRFDDYLDIVEDKVLIQKNIRIEYRWLDLENLRSVLNW